MLLLRYLDPPASAFMLQAVLQARAAGRTDFALDHRWLDWEALPPVAALAVVAAEDQKFPQHRGFDIAALRAAWRHNRRGGSLRGASTISQQLAKNLFLWPGRSLARKAIEAWFTALIELCLPKRRILELYLNLAQFGDGIYGIGAAAPRLLGKPAAALSAADAALLAAVLPSPLRLRAQAPGPYLRGRRDAILGQMRALGGTAYLAGL